jgi:Trk K+ transport system NAD-binding subunit
MDAVTVAAGSRLATETVGAVDATVAAVRPADGGIEAIPGRSRTLQAGDVLYVVARPEAIRRVTRLAASPTGAENGAE